MRVCVTFWRAGALPSRFLALFDPFGGPVSPPWLHFRPLVASLGCVLGILALRFGFRCQFLVFFSRLLAHFGRLWWHFGLHLAAQTHEIHGFT